MSKQGDMTQALSRKSTEELLKIWVEHDEESWLPEAFPMLRSILEARGVEVPAHQQRPQVASGEHRRTKPDRINHRPLALLVAALCTSIFHNIAKVITFTIRQNANITEENFRGWARLIGNLTGILACIGLIAGWFIGRAVVAGVNRRKWGRGGRIAALWFIAVAIVFGYFIGFALTGTETPTQRPTSFTPTNIDKNNYSLDSNLYRHHTHKFRIKFPEGWAIRRGDGPATLVKAVDDKGASININVKTIPASAGPASVSGVSRDETLESLRRAYSSVEMLQHHETRVSNAPALYMKYRATYSHIVGTVDFTMMQFIIPNNQSLLTLTCGAPTELFQEYESTFLGSVGTFILEDLFHEPQQSP